MKAQEQFATNTGRGGEEQLDAHESRRSIIHRFLEHEARRPDVAETGVNIDSLDSLLREQDRGGIIKKVDDTGERRISLARVEEDANVRYVPLSTLADNLDKVPEQDRRALGLFVASLPAIKEQIALLASKYGADLSPEHDTLLAVPDADRAKYAGGFYSSLQNQGHRMYDDISLLSYPRGVSERPEYVTADLMRAYAHDAVHALQKKNYRTLDPLVAETGRDIFRAPDQMARKLLRQMQKLKADRQESNMNLLQWGSFFPYDEVKTEDLDLGHVSLGVALFEYSTDMQARSMVDQHIANLPQPETAFEEVLVRDLQGKVVDAADVQRLRGESNMNIASGIRFFNENVVARATALLAMFGDAKDEILAAITDATMTGKFDAMQELRLKLDKSEWRDAAGKTIDKEGIKRQALYAMILRPLFPGTDWRTETKKIKQKA